MNAQRGSEVRRREKCQKNEAAEVRVHSGAAEIQQQPENRQEHERQKARTEHRAGRRLLRIEYPLALERDDVCVETLERLWRDSFGRPNDRLALEYVGLVLRHRTPRCVPIRLGLRKVGQEAVFQMEDQDQPQELVNVRGNARREVENGPRVEVAGRDDVADGTGPRRPIRTKNVDDVGREGRHFRWVRHALRNDIPSRHLRSGTQLGPVVPVHDVFHLRQRRGDPTLQQDPSHLQRVPSQ